MPPREQERSLLVKPVSGDCNLHCTYCFYYQRPGDPYQAQGRHLMSTRVLESLVKQGMRLNRRQATFGWQGGEPTLAGLDFFKKVVELEQKHGFSGQTVANGLQTNGLLLDASWARFLRQYNFLVGVSLDGPAPYHDAYRTYPRGAPTHERVVAALRLLAQHHVEFNILAVVNRLTAQHGAEIYDYFLSQGWRYIQFIPCVERDPATGQLADFSVEPERFGDFLCTVFDCWYNNGHPQASVRDFEAILAAYLGQEASMCSYQRECGSYLVVEYNGDVYPCDFMVDRKHYLGNLLEVPLEALFASEELRRFAARKAIPRPECRACPWLPYCHQGCPRFVGLDGPEHYLCRAYRRFFAHSHEGFIRLRDQILCERGVALAEAQSPARPVGRNDPCPCGSGKKYKACCRRRGPNVIRALIFDWGGVIQCTENEAPRTELAQELGLSLSELERAVFESRPFKEACLGQLSADEAWAAIVASLGWPAERVGEFVERFFAGDRLDERLVQLIRELRAQGYRVGLLSNAPPGRASSASPAGRWGMEGLFDAQVFSYQIGALKPDPRTYRAILKALGMAAHEALFIDDSPANVEGARALGMAAVHFVGTEGLLSELSLRLPLAKICFNDSASP